jgi:hypothetical protein
MQASTTDVLMKGWRRLGVVLSVLWFIGFGWWLRQADLDFAARYAGYATCIDLGDCDRASERFLSVVTPWWGIVIADALSIGALWLLAWIAVVVVRWVAAGFRQQA